MIDNDQAAAEQEQRIPQLHDREVSQVARVHGVTRNTEGRERDGEAVDEPEERLRTHNAVDEVSQQFGGEDRVLLDELGEVVESGGDGEGEEGEAQEDADVAQDGEDEHVDSECVTAHSDRSFQIGVENRDALH